MVITGNAGDATKTFVFAAASTKMGEHGYSKVLRGTVTASTPLEALEKVVRGLHDAPYSAVVGPDTGKGLVTEAAARYVSPQARLDNLRPSGAESGSVKPLVQVFRSPAATPRE